MPVMATKKQAWQNRIIGEGTESPDSLLANPLNWRIHPQQQQAGLTGVLDSVGWVQRVIVNQRTGHLVDGHLRVMLAMRSEQPEIPVLYVDLDEAEEALILATLDPIAAMAATDKAKLDALFGQIQTDSQAVQELIASIGANEGIIPPDFLPVGIEEQPRLDQKKPVICPECGHEFQA